MKGSFNEPSGDPQTENITGKRTGYKRTIAKPTLQQGRNGWSIAIVLDGRTSQSTCEHGPRDKRKRDSNVNALGQLLALNRFRRLARDYKQLSETLTELHVMVFTIRMLVHVCTG